MAQFDVPAGTAEIHQNPFCIVSVLDKIQTRNLNASWKNQPLTQSVHYKWVREFVASQLHIYMQQVVKWVVSKGLERMWKEVGMA
jgi:hypothetical protein